MKTVKYIGMIVLTVIMFAAFAACGGKNASSSVTASESPSAIIKQTQSPVTAESPVPSAKPTPSPAATAAPTPELSPLPTPAAAVDATSSATVKKKK